MMTTPLNSTMLRVRRMLCASLLLAPLALASAGATPTIGQPAPEFSLKDSHGQTRSLGEFKGKYVVLEWYNTQCPFVRKHYDSGNMQKLQQTYTGKGVVWLSINSSAPGKEGYLKPEEANKDLQKNKSAATAMLLDPQGVAGHLYESKNTPTMFIVDPKGILIYKGGIDDKASADTADIATAKNYVAAALDEALAGKPVTTSVSKPYGCSVKY